MFAVPEILWSPVANFLYSFFSPLKKGYPQLLRNNLLFDYKYENLLKIIIILQTIGVVASLIYWLKNKAKISSKIKFWIVLVVASLICLITLFVFYLAIIYNPSFF